MNHYHWNYKQSCVYVSQILITVSFTIAFWWIQSLGLLSRWCGKNSASLQKKLRSFILKILQFCETYCMIFKAFRFIYGTLPLRWMSLTPWMTPWMSSQMLSSLETLISPASPLLPISPFFSILDAPFGSFTQGVCRYGIDLSIS